jgi:membrane protease YdiL (CAAX protease family)
MSEVAPPLDRATDRKARIRAFLRFLGFLMLSIGLVIVLTLSMQLSGADAALSPGNIVIVQGATASIIAFATFIMIRATREPATFFGWGSGHRMRHFGLGIVAGLGLMTLLLGSMCLLGGITFGLPVLGFADALRGIFVFAVIFILTAVSEEGLLRGYGFVQLSRALSFWPAAIASSLIFAGLHLGNASETAAGVSAVALVGLVLAYSFRRSGALWFAWGYHAAWDFAESFVYGVPDSGVVMPGAFLAPQFHGPDWLTGGNAGPEGSLLVFPALALLAVIAHVGLRPRSS